MVFFIPLVVGAFALAGGGLAAEGAHSLLSAKERAGLASQRHGRAAEELQAALGVTFECAAEVAERMRAIHEGPMTDLVDFIRSQARAAHLDEQEFLADFDIEIPDLPQWTSWSIDGQEVLGSAVGVAIAAFTARQAAVTVVAMFGHASTGVAISSLSGAAASNATLAALGGGALAAGGGGVALGQVVLNGIAPGVGLFLGGLALSSAGDKAKTEVAEFEAEVDTAVARMAATVRLQPQVRQDLRQFDEVLEALSVRLQVALRELRAKDFDMRRDAATLQRAILLARALREVMSRPFMAEDWTFSPHAAEWTRRMADGDGPNDD